MRGSVLYLVSRGFIIPGLQAELERYQLETLREAIDSAERVSRRLKRGDTTARVNTVRQRPNYSKTRNSSGDDRIRDKGLDRDCPQAIPTD